MSNLGERFRASTAVNTWIGTAASPDYGPASVSGLTAWYDASDAAYVTVSSGQAASVTDRSGNGFTLTGTYPNAPNWNARTQNGLPVLSFYDDSGAKRLQNDHFTLAQPCTIFMAASIDVTTNGGIGFRTMTGWTNNYNGSGQGCQFPITSGKLQLFAGGSFVGDTQLTAGAAFQATAVFNGSASHLDVNGAAGSPVNPGTDGWTDGPLQIGDVWAALNGDSYAAPFDGWIGELIYYSGALGSTDRATIEAYLKSKWATG